MEQEESVTIPIDGVLDLHHFNPREVGDLVPEYLEECRRRGIVSVRIIHGKGVGNLRRGVHAILGRLPFVRSFGPGGVESGGWGATLVELAPLVATGSPAGILEE
ncbi:MAG TPA: Smr/MutS family protein [Verrucomicrobiae bacterium]|nr:Smr/MutS family protein [Verrucomicrobiae bacterium]